MRHRCYNEYHHKYPLYGGRGVQVCARWRESFLDFLADVGERPTRSHTIDRIDPDGHYEPGNVRWATPKEQQNNRRNSAAIRERNALAEGFGVNVSTLQARLNRGMSLIGALYLPLHVQTKTWSKNNRQSWDSCFPNGSSDCYLR